MSRAEPVQRADDGAGVRPAPRDDRLTVPALVWSCVDDPPVDLRPVVERFCDLAESVAAAARAGPGGVERRLDERAERYAALRGGVLAAWPRERRALDARQARTCVLRTLGRAAPDAVRTAVWPALEDLADLASRSREPVRPQVGVSCQVSLARFELALAALVRMVETPGPFRVAGALAVAGLAVQAGTLTRGLLECDLPPRR